MRPKSNVEMRPDWLYMLHAGATLKLSRAPKAHTVYSVMGGT